MTDFANHYSRALRYGGFHTEADFHAAIHANPEERTTALVYADWREEQGRPAMAEVIRKHANSEDSNAAEVGDISHLSCLQPGWANVDTLHDRDPEQTLILSQRSLTEPTKFFQWATVALPRTETQRLTKGLQDEGVSLSRDAASHAAKHKDPA